MAHPELPTSFGGCLLELASFDADLEITWKVAVSRLDPRVGGSQTVGNDWECRAATRDGAVHQGFGSHGLGALQSLLRLVRAHLAPTG